MDLRRLRAGEWIVGAAGVALFVSLFLDWYGVKGAHSALSGWEAFDFVDVLLAAVAGAGVALAVVTATQRTPAVPVAMASLVTLAAAVAVVLVLYRAIDLPDAFVGGVLGGIRVHLGLTRSGGLWLALGSSTAMLAGALLAIRDQTPGAPAPPPEPEELPAPTP